MARRLLSCIPSALILFCTSVFLLIKWLPEDDHSFTLFSEPHYWVEDVDYGDKFVNKDGPADRHDLDIVNASSIGVQYPIILWWNPLTGDRGKLKSCDGERKCIFTTDRHFQHNPKTKVFMFYGTDFDKDDLPLPREEFHQWAILHEESPKNNYLLTRGEVITIFNHTATFQGTSHYPLTTQYLSNLNSLLSDEYFVSTKQKNERTWLAPVVYIHTDCNPPSDRDTFAAELMKHIPIDSYGKCLHNKDLPGTLQDMSTWDNKELYKLLAQYKFTLSIENAICDDYVTEKLWRPLTLGTVPIYKGSPKVRDWLPSNHSVILVDDFQNAKELAKYLQFLIRNDAEYNTYLQFRKNGIENKQLIEAMGSREWGVNNFKKINFITGFECFVCNRVHENLKLERLKQEKFVYLARPDHLNCPRPEPFGVEGSTNAIQPYQQMFDNSKSHAKELRKRLLNQW